VQLQWKDGPLAFCMQFCLLLTLGASEIDVHRIDDMFHMSCRFEQQLRIISTELRDEGSVECWFGGALLHVLGAVRRVLAEDLRMKLNTAHTADQRA
jgi:hypothetical protein